MKRRLLTLTAVSLVLMLALAGCGKNVKKDRQRTPRGGVRTRTGLGACRVRREDAFRRGVSPYRQRRYSICPYRGPFQRPRRAGPAGVGQGSGTGEHVCPADGHRRRPGPWMPFPSRFPNWSPTKPWRVPGKRTPGSLPVRISTCWPVLEPAAVQESVRRQVLSGYQQDSARWQEFKARNGNAELDAEIAKAFPEGE
jgi:hypothetical protein